MKSNFQPLCSWAARGRRERRAWARTPRERANVRVGTPFSYFEFKIDATAAQIRRDESVSVSHPLRLPRWLAAGDDPGVRKTRGLQSELVRENFGSRSRRPFCALRVYRTYNIRQKYMKFEILEYLRLSRDSIIRVWIREGLVLIGSPFFIEILRERKRYTPFHS